MLKDIEIAKEKSKFETEIFKSFAQFIANTISIKPDMENKNEAVSLVLSTMEFQVPMTTESIDRFIDKFKKLLKIIDEKCDYSIDTEGLDILKFQKENASVKLSTRPMIPWVRPENDYPCFTFSVMGINDKISKIIQAGDKMSDAEVKQHKNKCLDATNAILLLAKDTFVGLLNAEALKKYGESAPLVGTLGSFGYSRPSINMTVDSFRFNLGDVPEDYGMVVALAYERLNKALVQLFKNNELISALNNNSHHEIKSNLQYLTKNFLNARRISSNIATNVMLKSIQHEENDIMVNLLGGDENNSELTFCRNREKLDSTESEEIIKRRVSNTDSVFSLTKESSSTAIPPKHVLDLMAVLQAKAQELCSVNKTNHDYLLCINSLISAERANYEDATKDWSLGLAYCERMTRLIKHYYELEHLHKHGTELGQGAREIESIITKDKGVELEHTYITRGGMHSLSLVLEGLSQFLDKN